ncbi:MAG TPA: hypothetical protein DCZ92_04030 [Elusimicrobia bacterium]|nr:MAG: hypothetical protein A2016_08195 [Elusimicrobia bacterium GWF2_62_30]HBA59985.1 hypothetical protein [Elusimicrobiota bacterium]
MYWEQETKERKIMNKNKLTMLVLASGFALALAAPAAAEKKGACAEDTAKFCKDVKPGEGRVKACLKEHEKELSQACRERREKAAENRASRRGGKETAGFGAGKKGGFTCMTAYDKGFSRGFKRGMKMNARFGKRGRGKATAMAAGACKDDARKLCEGIKPGQGRVRDCLQKNQDKLSEGCKTRQEKIKDRKENKEEKPEKV